MQAFAEGKVVQMWVPDHDPGAKVPGVWVDIKDPTFDIRENWRVKPEPEPTPEKLSGPSEEIWDLEPSRRLCIHAQEQAHTGQMAEAVEVLALALSNVICNLQKQPCIVQPDK